MNFQPIGLIKQVSASTTPATGNIFTNMSTFLITNLDGANVVNVNLNNSGNVYLPPNNMLAYTITNNIHPAGNVTYSVNTIAGTAQVYISPGIDLS